MSKWGNVKFILKTYFHNKVIILKVQKLHETGEYVVRYFENEKYNENASYFAGRDDLADAVGTANLMVKRLNDLSHR